jgi:hypothetical protein
MSLERVDNFYGGHVYSWQGVIFDPVGLDFAVIRWPDGSETSAPVAAYTRPFVVGELHSIEVVLVVCLDYRGKRFELDLHELEVVELVFDAEWYGPAEPLQTAPAPHRGAWRMVDDFNGDELAELDGGA